MLRVGPGGEVERAGRPAQQVDAEPGGALGGTVVVFVRRRDDNPAAVDGVDAIIGPDSGVPVEDALGRLTKVLSEAVSGWQVTVRLTTSSPPPAATGPVK